MFAQGMAGMLRRMADGGAGYSIANNPDAIGGLADRYLQLNVNITLAYALGIFPDPFHHQFVLQH